MTAEGGRRRGKLPLALLLRATGGFGEAISAAIPIPMPIESTDSCPQTYVHRSDAQLDFLSVQSERSIQQHRRILCPL